jgi:hypothetical protein
MENGRRRKGKRRKCAGPISEPATPIVSLELIDELIKAPPPSCARSPPSPPYEVEVERRRECRRKGPQLYDLTPASLKKIPEIYGTTSKFCLESSFSSELLFPVASIAARAPSPSRVNESHFYYLGGISRDHAIAQLFTNHQRVP